MLPTRSDSRARMRCMHPSLLCRPAPIVGRARNGRPVPKWTSAPMDAEPGAPAPPGLVPYGGACSQGQHGYARCAPTLSRMQLDRPHAHALPCRRSSNTRRAQSTWTDVATQQARGTKHAGRRNNTRVRVRPDVRVLTWPFFKTTSWVKLFFMLSQRNGER